MTTDTPGRGTPDERVTGFHQALLRYRRAVLVGWLLVAAGVMGILLRWDARLVIGLMDILLSALVVGAGLILVSQSLEFLSAYARALFQPGGAGGGELTDIDRELEDVAREVEEGGWQEAFAAVGRVRAIADRHGLSIPE